jgi:hypothetical protein
VDNSQYSCPTQDEDQLSPGFLAILNDLPAVPSVPEERLLLDDALVLEALPTRSAWQPLPGASGWCRELLSTLDAGYPRARAVTG